MNNDDLHWSEGYTTPVELQSLMHNSRMLDEPTLAALQHLDGVLESVCSPMENTSHQQLIRAAVEGVLHKMEEQMVTFYEHINNESFGVGKKNSLDSSTVTTSTLESSYQELLSLMKPSDKTEHMHNPSSPQRFSTNTRMPRRLCCPSCGHEFTTSHPTVRTNPRYGRKASMSSPRGERHKHEHPEPPSATAPFHHAALGTILYASLESIMERTRSRRGAIYLPVDGAQDVLRAAVMIGDGGLLPGEVSMTSGAVIGTVCYSGVAYCLNGRSYNEYGHKRKVTSENDNGNYNAVSITPLNNVALRVETALCFPVLASKDRDEASSESNVPRSSWNNSFQDTSNHFQPTSAMLPPNSNRAHGCGSSTAHAIGCILLADTVSPGGYELAHEQRLWGFTQWMSSLFERYAATAFFQSRPDITTLRALSRFPGVVKCVDASIIQTKQNIQDEVESNSLTSPSEIKANAATANSVRDTVMLPILRTSRRDVYARDLSCFRVDTLCGEELLQECGNYMRSLEKMWREMLNDNATLQRDVQHWKSVASDKDVQLAMRESSLKRLLKQFRSIQTDMARVKSHMREEALLLGGAEADAPLEETGKTAPVKPPGKGSESPTRQSLDRQSKHKSFVYNKSDPELPALHQQAIRKTVSSYSSMQSRTKKRTGMQTSNAPVLVGLVPPSFSSDTPENPGKYPQEKPTHVEEEAPTHISLPKLIQKKSGQK